MISLQKIREEREKIETGLKKKNCFADLNVILELDRKRKEVLKVLEPKRDQQKEEGKKMAREVPEEKKNIQAFLAQLAAEIKALEKELEEVEARLHAELFALPNPALPSVPEGTKEEENVCVKEGGVRPSFSFIPQHHLIIGKKLKIIDTERAAKVSGTRFAYLLGQGVKLQFALIQYACALLEEEGFKFILPPVLAKESVIEGMGYLPEADQDMFKIEKDGLRLAATSEQTIGPFYQGEILEEENLPEKFLGYSSCFRREAGSYGKDVKGIMRVHQFDKLEMFVFCRPEESEQVHEYLVSLEEKIVAGLGLAYRIVNVCGGELGFPAAKKYDVECWIPSEGRYRETHSCSNCTDFQSRRLQIRFRRKKSRKVEYVHTLNGTAIACGRMIVAILENNQREDGAVVIPEPLRKFMGNQHFLLPPG